MKNNIVIHHWDHSRKEFPGLSHKNAVELVDVTCLSHDPHMTQEWLSHDRTWLSHVHHMAPQYYHMWTMNVIICFSRCTKALSNITYSSYKQSKACHPWSFNTAYVAAIKPIIDLKRTSKLKKSLNQGGYFFH